MRTKRTVLQVINLRFKLRVLSADKGIQVRFCQSIALTHTQLLHHSYGSLVVTTCKISKEFSHLQVLFKST